MLESTALEAILQDLRGEATTVPMDRGFLERMIEKIKDVETEVGTREHQAARAEGA